MSSQSSLIPVKQSNKHKIQVVLKGFSHIACGKGMKVQDQQKKLFDFVYGKPPHVVSNYELLVKGLSGYAYLYEEETFKQKNEEGKAVNVDGLKLRPELILNYTMPYSDGLHITIANMKSSNRSGKVTYPLPKTLLNWARTAATEFCRADALCAK